MLGRMVKLPEYLQRTTVGGEQVSREVLDAHQRDRVIGAAIPIFAKRGYGGTTVDDLLASGRIGVGNFYSLFEGKEDCFLAVFDSLVGFARGEISEAVEAAEDWAEEAFLGLRRLLDIIGDDPRAARVVLIEAQAAGAEATRRYEALLDSATEWLHAGRAEMKSGDVLPPTFERSTIAGLAYYLQQCLFSGAALDVEGLFDEVATVLLAPILGAEELRRLRQVLVDA
jgi:AcrR family transcriptional regulator